MVRFLSKSLLLGSTFILLAVAKKVITPFTAQLVTFDTTLPVAEVLARLDDVVNKTGSGQFLAELNTASTGEEIENIINSTVGSSGFLFFGSLSYQHLLNALHNVTNTPTTALYTIGNPLVAETIIKYDLRAALNIPPQILVLEKADGNGTDVIYHLPSSVMALPGASHALREAAKALDEKLELMVKSITAVSHP